MSGYYSVNPEELLRFQLKRINTVEFKAFLIMLDELAKDHDIAMQKLHDKLPSEFKDYVDLADYFTESKYDVLRKKVLDTGNDTYRNIEELLKQFEVKFKE